MIDQLTVVVIGKNEGLNLPRCFSSIKEITDNIIFVDSDSSDDSIDIAKKHKIKKIIRAKANFGTPALSRSIGAKHVKTDFIQFLDGDMEIEKTWVSHALDFLKKNQKVAVVHGYKKVFKKDLINYFILSDTKNWQADYLQGAFLIRKKCYETVGGFDYKFFGEEERDLYVRLLNSNYQVWYLHKLMSSHYDFKKKGLLFLLMNGIGGGMWLPLLKSIKNRMLKSYIFVYRYLLFPLFCEFFSIAIIFFIPSFPKIILYILFIQSFELLYCLSIKRKGYFVIWKTAILNIYKTFQLIRRKLIYELEYH